MVNDTTIDQNNILDDAKGYSELSTPIVFKGKLIGVMDSENEEKDFYNQYLHGVHPSAKAPNAYQTQLHKKLLLDTLAIDFGYITQLDFI